MQNLLSQSKDVRGEPGDPDYEEVTKRVTELHRRWERLKQILERRVQLGNMYQQFHKYAVEFIADIDTLEAMIKTSKDVVDQRAQQQFEDLWSGLGSGFGRMKSQGDKFLTESRSHTQDPDLDVQRAQLCIETLLEHFSSRHNQLAAMWSEWKKKSLQAKESQDAWDRFSRKCRDTMEWIKKLENEAIVAFGRFEELPFKVADKQQKALNEFLPNSKKVQAEIESRLKSAEILSMRADRPRAEKDMVVDELLRANQRFQEIVTWFQVICNQTITFFRNMHQVGCLVTGELRV